MRKSYGLAVSNMGAGGNSDEVACWITAEVSFMKPEFGAQIAYGASPDNPDEFKAAVAKMNKGTTPYDMASYKDLPRARPTKRLHELLEKLGLTELHERFATA